MRYPSLPRWPTAFATLASLAAFALTAATALHAAPPPPPLPLDGFADCIHHWRNANHITDYPRLADADVRGIADNILLYQRANGGWRENEDPLRILPAEEQARILADRTKTDTSLDNRNTWPQVEYLAGAFRLTGDPRYRDAAVRGLDFIFSAQHASGGFPHSFPSTESYKPHLTFADDILPDVLRFLRKVAAGAAPFEFIDAERRARAAAAFARGDACILTLQVRQSGVPTVWAGQYHHVTLAPVGARAFELPALVSRESVAVVRYLMSVESPSPEMMQAIDSAVAWFERVSINGLRLETFAAEPIKYQWHTSTTDRRTVPDASAPPLWARFYDLKTSEPFLANRDGERVFSLAEVARERRTGYDWYGRWPEELLRKDYPAWRRQLLEKK
jgi:PelA/Pel-15E family pectate lyase